ncbi:predicted protein [Uncinocarpus reesii 1704]|uniref:Uncharacterized protein n=1 Tax=Uncinocarpus reesii (strain UAMH 1704) TaxID=336963 RepID=C4JIV1_UNCRE|nr:uncharacterized protein UREG_01558 [Uncinocarpus reesii 1704]EEP76709.1 predicted protein [Uncinocarpus reesii 1704]
MFRFVFGLGFGRLSTPYPVATVAVVYSQLSPVRRFVFEYIKSYFGTFNINKVGMGETPCLPGPSVNGDTDINNVIYVSEKFIKVAISHFK